MINLGVLLQVTCLLNSQSAVAVQQNVEISTRKKEDLTPGDGSGSGNSGVDKDKYVDYALPDFKVESYIKKYFCPEDRVCTFEKTEYNEINTSGILNPFSIGYDSTNLFSLDTLTNGLKASDSTRDSLDCGPVAVAGILDFFGFNLKYKSIYNLTQNDYSTSKPTTNLVSEQVKAATKAFNNTHVTPVPTGDAYAMPIDVEEGVNKSLKEYGIDNEIKAINYATNVESQTRSAYETVKYAVDQGMPLTVLHGSLNPNNDQFAAFTNHCSTVFGYESWVVKYPDVNHQIDLNFIIGCNNATSPYSRLYCPAEILVASLGGLVRYERVVNYSPTINESVLKPYFLNEQGQGQYFFEEKTADISIQNKTIKTRRLRSSVIEDNYIVLSPYRKNAGTAYIEFEIPGKFINMNFDIGKWRPSDNYTNQTLRIECYYDNSYKTVTEIDIDNDLGLTDKDNLKHYNFQLPDGVNKVRFYTSTPYPSGTSNKGRIVINNVKFNCYLK